MYLYEQIKKLLHLCDDSYSFGDVISMELSLLYDLGGVMITPHPIVFLPRFLHMFDDSAEVCDIVFVSIYF